jgi:predicted nicotinamide N-methyase
VPATGINVAQFIRERFELAPLPFRPDISLYRPTPRSGLNRWLAEQGHGETPPYWAYAWAGGSALALFLAEHPETVSGKSVLDFGAGSGLVAIAAAKAGARTVQAFEPDPIGRVAAKVNGEANGVDFMVVEQPVASEIILAGDVFYDAAVAARTLPVLSELARRGTVLVGDPFRRDLPLGHLGQLAEYLVPDMGGGKLVRAGVFSLRPS